jgi:hypothetical protein
MEGLVDVWDTRKRVRDSEMAASSLRDVGSRLVLAPLSA